MAVDPSGKFAYVANEGGFAPTNVSMYTIDATTGALTSIGTIAAGGRAISVAVDPSGKFAYVANGLPGCGNVSMYTINATTGALTSIGLVAGRNKPYLRRRGSDWQVRLRGEFRLDQRLDVHHRRHHGDLNVYRNDSRRHRSYSIAIDPSGKFAYVTNSGSNNVSMYTSTPPRGP